MEIINTHLAYIGQGISGSSKGKAQLEQMPGVPAWRIQRSTAHCCERNERAWYFPAPHGQFSNTCLRNSKRFTGATKTYTAAPKLPHFRHVATRICMSRKVEQRSMAFPPSKVNWYLTRSGKQYGPSSDLDMLNFIELGHLRPNDLLWREGFSEWRPATVVFPELQEVPNLHHTDPVDSSIIVGEPLVAARPPQPRAISRKALALAFFLIFALSGAALYAYFRSDWHSSVPSSTSPEERDATSIRLGPDSTDSGNL